MLLRRLYQWLSGESLNSLIFFIILAELLIVAWVDIKIKKIFNYWFFINSALSIGLHYFLPEYYPMSWEILIVPIGWIVFGFLLFLLGIMGAGDSKYLASLFLVVPLERHFSFLEHILIATFWVAGFILLINIIRNFRDFKAYTISAYWIGIKNKLKSSFSYAPVILLAWLLEGLSLWK